MAKKIISIGFDIPGHSDLFEPYSSSQSLLDADVVIFESDFSSYSAYGKFYQGKPSFSEDTSFQITEATNHWLSELNTALEYGKTVFVIFNQYKEVFIHTGEKQYSGTGRNARVTNIVTTYHNYKFLPIRVPKIVPKEGSEIVFVNDPVFASFWKEMKEYLIYESYFDGNIPKMVFCTKTGNKPVAGVFPVGKGHLVFLPAINIPDDFSEEKGDEFIWTKKALKFGQGFMKLILDIDAGLRSGGEKTPSPAWVESDDYELQMESALKERITKDSEQINSLTLERNELIVRLEKEREIKGLLFEKGKPLENAVIDALHILEYKAENLKEGLLEFDQVIVSPESDRFIGECEGRDDAAIGIDKFRQLESNIQDDLGREEVNEPALGILFGNGFRLQVPQERQTQFTEKCLKSAARSSIVLVQTTDLYAVVKYVKESGDKAFAKECRKTIQSSKGQIVKFPALPIAEVPEAVPVKEKAPVAEKEPQPK